MSIEQSTARVAGMSVVGFLGESHACVDWHQDRIKEFDVHTALSSNDLMSYIDHFYQKGKL